MILKNGYTKKVALLITIEKMLIKNIYIYRKYINYLKY
jgi:hypothetical protein